MIVKTLTCVDEAVLAEEALFRLLLVRVEAEHKDVAHGDEKMGEDLLI